MFIEVAIVSTSCEMIYAIVFWNVAISENASLIFDDCENFHYYYVTYYAISSMLAANYISLFIEETQKQINDCRLNCTNNCTPTLRRRYWLRKQQQYTLKFQYRIEKSTMSHYPLGDPRKNKIRVFTSMEYFAASCAHILND